MSFMFRDRKDTEFDYSGLVSGTKSDSKKKFVLRSLRSFYAFCLEKDVQPLMHLDNDNGYLYVKCPEFRVRSPLLLKNELHKVWNEIGVFRMKLRETMQLINLEDPTFKEL